MNKSLSRKSATIESDQFGLSDTSDAMRQVQCNLLSRLPPEVRLDKAFRLSNEMATLSKQAIIERHPEFSDHQIKAMFVEIHYGKDLADKFRTFLKIT